jgi:hypothetical protein
MQVQDELLPWTAPHLEEAARISVAVAFCAELTVSAIAVHSLASELSYSHRRLGPMVSGTQVEVKNCNKGEITALRIFTVSQKESHSVQKLKLVFIYLVLHLILHNTRKIRPHT